LSAAMDRTFNMHPTPHINDNELYTQFKYTKLEGFDYGGGDGTISRRDPTKVLFENGNLLADPDAGDNLPMAQSRFPVTEAEFMRGSTFPAADPTNAEVRSALEVRLAEEDPNWTWDAEFTAVFGDAAITYARIAEAIGEYERSQVFVNNAWKTFMEGDDAAISEAARRGALVFMLPTRVDGASCITCHRGDFFTDELFHVLGMPQIGRGKGDGETLTDDFGRFRVSASDADMYAFRTPTMLNVAVTGPWGHSGAYTTLEAVIRHHLDPQAALDNYDFNQLEASIVDSGQTDDTLVNTQNALNKLAANRLAGILSVPVLTLTDQQVSDLVEFLKTLTDPCVQNRTCLAPWIPDDSIVDPDGLRLNGVDQDLNPL